MEWARCGRRRPSRGRPAATGPPVSDYRRDVASYVAGLTVSGAVAGEVKRHSGTAPFTQTAEPVTTGSPKGDTRSPVASSIDRPATPVATQRVTLSATSSGSSP